MKTPVATLLSTALLLAAGQAFAADPARDRQSILAMQGDYTVDFAFDETVLLQPGYERQAASAAAAMRPSSSSKTRRAGSSSSTSWSTPRVAT